MRVNVAVAPPASVDGVAVTVPGPPTGGSIVAQPGGAGGAKASASLTAIQAMNPKVSQKDAAALVRKLH